MAFPTYRPPGGGPAAPRVDTGGYLRAGSGYRAAPHRSPTPAVPTHRIDPVDPFQQALAGDPLYGQAQADTLAAHNADQAARNAQIGSALIGFGQDPGSLPAGYRPDAQTLAAIQAANASGVSTSSRLALADRLAQLGINQSLAGRGMAFSGETPFQLGNEQTQFRQQQFDARNQVLQTLAGLQSDYARNEAARQRALYQAAYQATQRQIQQMRLTGGAPLVTPAARIAGMGHV